MVQVDIEKSVGNLETLELHHGVSDTTFKIEHGQDVRAATPASRDVDDDDGHCGADDDDEEEENYVHDSWKVHKFRVVTCFASFFLLGLNDSTPGALLLYMEAYYHQTYTIISLCFLAPYIGYMVAAFTNALFHVWIGRQGTGVMALGLLTVSYALNCWAPPLPLLIISYGISGLGNGTMDAAFNAFIGDLDSANEILGFMHGFYGAGAVVSPLVSTAMISSGVKWSYYYFILLGYALLMTILTAISFKGETGKKYVQDHPLKTDADGNTQGRTKEALTNKYVWVLAFFIFFYMGAEVGVGSWTVAFMVKERHGLEKKMGGVASGFWAGIAAGRIFLGFVTGKVGEKLMCAIYLALAIAFELVFWLAPSIVASAVGVAFVGFFFGPLFPTAIVAATSILPKRLHVTGIGFAASFGGTGAAIFPFITGAMAESKGPWVLQPLVLSMIVIMLLLWVSLPNFGESALLKKMQKMIPRRH